MRRKQPVPRPLRGPWWWKTTARRHRPPPRHGPRLRRPSRTGPSAETAETLALVVSQLATNALRHGGGRYWMRLHADADTLYVAMSASVPRLRGNGLLTSTAAPAASAGTWSAASPAASPSPPDPGPAKPCTHPSLGDRRRGGQHLKAGGSSRPGRNSRKPPPVASLNTTPAVNALRRRRGRPRPRPRAPCPGRGTGTGRPHPVVAPPRPCQRPRVNRYPHQPWSAPHRSRPDSARTRARCMDQDLHRLPPLRGDRRPARLRRQHHRDRHRLLLPRHHPRPSETSSRLNLDCLLYRTGPHSSTITVGSDRKTSRSTGP